MGHALELGCGHYGPGLAPGRGKPCHRPGQQILKVADSNMLSFEIKGKNKIVHLISSQYVRPVSYTHLDVYKRQALNTLAQV